MFRERSSPRFAGEKGQTLLELIVVITVSAIIIGALVFATISSLRNTQLSKNQAQATKLAQEAIEKVRSGRDRGSPIAGSFTIGGASIDSWQDPDLWSNQINGNCGNNTFVPPTFCYFKFNSSGAFQYLISDRDIPSSAEDPLGDGKFKRVVILSDEAANNLYQVQKNVTVIVRWHDFSGDHDSRLTTILRKI